MATAPPPMRDEDETFVSKVVEFFGVIVLGTVGCAVAVAAIGIGAYLTIQAGIFITGQATEIGNGFVDAVVYGSNGGGGGGGDDSNICRKLPKFLCFDPSKRGFDYRWGDVKGQFTVFFMTLVFLGFCLMTLWMSIRIPLGVSWVTFAKLRPLMTISPFVIIFVSFITSIDELGLRTLLSSMFFKGKVLVSYFSSIAGICFIVLYSSFIPEQIENDRKSFKITKQRYKDQFELIFSYPYVRYCLFILAYINLTGYISILFTLVPSDYELYRSIKWYDFFTLWKFVQ